MDSRKASGGWFGNFCISAMPCAHHRGRVPCISNVFDAPDAEAEAQAEAFIKWGKAALTPDGRGEIYMPGVA
jgi:hypothetical protein